MTAFLYIVLPYFLFFTAGALAVWAIAVVYRSKGAAESIGHLHAHPFTACEYPNCCNGTYCSEPGCDKHKSHAIHQTEPDVDSPGSKRTNSGRLNLLGRHMTNLTSR
jgi:hypothetical protein